MSKVETKDVAISRELYYTTKASSHPTYKLSRIVPREGGADITITPGGTQDINFEIPTKVFNLAKSELSFNFSIALTALNYTWMYSDTIPFISEIQLVTRSGQYLCNLSNVQNFVKIIRKKETSLDEYLSYDATDLLYRVNANTATAFAAGVQGDTRPNNTSVSISQTEPRYLRRSALATALAGQVQFRLDALKNTIFAYDKDLMFPEIIVMRVVFGPGTKVGFVGTSVSDPTDASVAALAANVTISSLYLYLSVEQDQSLINGLSAKIKTSGLSLPIQYTTSYKITATGTSHNLTQRFTRSNGMTLQKIIHSPYSGTEQSNTAYDCSNVNGSKITSYYSLLDNNRIQEFDIRCATANLEDWLVNKKTLKGSVYQSSNQYQFDWFHCEDWSCMQPPSESKSIDDSNLICGLALGNEEVKWDMYITATGTLSHYYYAVFQKRLEITGTNVTVT